MCLLLLMTQYHGRAKIRRTELHSGSRFWPPSVMVFFLQSPEGVHIAWWEAGSPRNSARLAFLAAQSHLCVRE